MDKTLYIKLKPVADAHLVNYREDFTKHDKRTLNMSKPGDVFVWVCRENGTHMQQINAREDRGITVEALTLSWDLLDALRDMVEVRAIYMVECLSPMRGQVTKLDTIPARPEALRNVHNRLPLFA